MWKLKKYADLERRLKKFSKKHRQETLNALDNLQTYLNALNSGLLPLQISRKWVHSEPKGIKALDQSGPGNPRATVRLYVFPDESSEELHVFTIGDKSTQQDDIPHCETTVSELLKQQELGKSTSHGQKETTATEPEATK